MSIVSTLNSHGFISVNKSLIKEIGLNNAVYLGELLSQRVRFGEKEFFFSQKQMEDEIGMNEGKQRNCMNYLIELGFVSVIKKGLPAKYYYNIDTNKIIDFFEKITNNNSVIENITNDNNVIASAISPSQSIANGTNVPKMEQNGTNDNNKIFENESTSPCKSEALDIAKVKHIDKNNNNKNYIQKNDLLSHKGDNTKSDDFELSNFLEKKKEMVQGVSIGSINHLGKEKEKSSAKKEKESLELIEYKPKAITTDINNFIEKLKSECDKRGVAYLSKNDRNFAKFILTAKDYGDFANGIGQTREQFAINILDASIKINYWKGICSGPMSIYQNYQDVFNQTKLRTKKEKETKKDIPFIPSIYKDVR